VDQNLCLMIPIRTGHVQAREVIDSCVVGLAVEESFPIFGQTVLSRKVVDYCKFYEGRKNKSCTSSHPDIDGLYI
jgi:hypothetical protein